MSSSSSNDKCYYDYNIPIDSFNTLLKNSNYYIESINCDKNSFEIIDESFSNIKDYQISNSSISIKNDKNILLHIKLLSRQKIIKKYNCTKEKYNTYMINNLLRNEYCRIVSLFKDILLKDSNIEYFFKYFKRTESKKLIKKFYPFYVTYFHFYCKPILNKISLAMTIKQYYDLKAKCFLNLNEDNNDKSNKEDNNSKKYSDSSDTFVKESKTDRLKIFDSKTKEILDNVTVMTTIPDNLEDGSINLNLNKERIEIYRENKREYSNESTFAEIIDYIQNKKNRKNNNSYNSKKTRNKLKSELLKNKSTFNKNKSKNYLNNKKNNSELNNAKNNFINFINNHNKKNITINKLNVFLQKIKLNNFGKKKNKKKINEANDKSLDNLNRKNDERKNINNNSNYNVNSNFGNIIAKSSILNNIEVSNIYKRITDKKINDEIKKNFKNINEYQNKENTNINNIKNINNNKNLKKNNKSINNLKAIKDNKIINQKISFKSRNIKSRNKTSFYLSIHSISSINPNSEKNINAHKKKISSLKTFVKNQTNNNKTITINSDTSKLIISPKTKINHIKNKTKFFKCQNTEKIIKNIYSKIKKTRKNSRNYNSIHINNNQNNKSTLFRTLVIDNNSLNSINYNNINSPVNIQINKSISNLYLKQSIYQSMYNNQSLKILKKFENSKMKFGVKKNKNKNDHQRYNTNFNQNSVSTIHNNKSNSLNKTGENNQFSNNNINFGNSIKKSNNSIINKNKFIYNKKLNNINFKRNKNIKLNTNNSQNNNKGKNQINLDENKYKKIKKINSFSSNRIICKSPKFKDISINKKEIKNTKCNYIKMAKKISNEKNKDRNTIYGTNDINNKSNNNFNNINNCKNKENKIIIRNQGKKILATKTIKNYSRNNNEHNINMNNNEINGMNSFHYKSLSTYGLDLNSKKFFK